MKFCLMAALILCASVASAADITAVSQSWRVQPAFEKDGEARNAVSGAACVAGTSHCLVANDEKQYAQFFEIEDSVLVPGPVIKLLADQVNDVKMDDIDAEGVAFAGGHFFITGSHGLSRNSGELRPSVFHVFRVTVDNRTGLPAFAFDDDDPVPEIESTSRLREVIKAQPELAPFAEQRLNQNGANIEGIAPQGGDLLFGFRAPSVGEGKDRALVLRVSADALFSNEQPTAGVHTLTLEPGLGIRDMAAASDMVLLLVGPSADVSGEGSLWRWDGWGETPEKIGVLPDVVTTMKPETLLVLAEDDTMYRVLVLFDGMDNGGPREFVITK